MTPQQLAAMKMALDLAIMHYTDDGYAALRAKVRSASKEALAEHAMRETQRLGQEIEQEPKIKTTDPFESSRVADYNRGWNDCLFAFGIVKQPEQEPVAIERMKEWIEYLKRKSDFGQHMKIPSEMSAGTCWELALELEQFINTAPSQQEPVIDKSAAIRIATSLGWTPQRKPLTDEEIEKLADDFLAYQIEDYQVSGVFTFARAIEAAHGIKENT